MKAVVITQFGGPEVLKVEERPIPEPAAGQVRVKVLSAGVNRGDLSQRRGYYPAPPGSPADIPGLEMMGVIDAIGENVSAWQIGQRVFGLLGGGGYSEYVVTEQRLLAPVPDNLPDIEAGAIPEVFMTAHDALIQAGFKQGNHVLIHAAGSGVGTAAIQLVHAMKGISYGTARSAEKLKKAKQLGLDYPIQLPEFFPEIHKVTSGKGVNIILDFVGAPYLKQNLDSLAPLGCIVQIGTMGGIKGEINLNTLMSKRLRIIGTVMRSRTLEEKAAVTQRFTEQVVKMLSEGKVHPVVDRVFPLEKAAEAHLYLENNSNFGKVVLKPND